MTDVLHAALDYRSRDYFVTPAIGKAPVLDDWPNARLDEDAIRREFRQGRNVGVILGASGLADLDFDDEAAVRAMEIMTPPELGGAARFEHAGRPHLIVRAVVATRQFKRANGSVLLELRGAGAQTIFPPSVHPDDGLPYTWVEDREPRAVGPGRLQTIAVMIATAAYSSEFWRLNSRHDLALSLAGFLARRASGDDAVSVIRTAAVMAQDEEIDDRLLAVETTVQRLREGEAVTGLPTVEDTAPELAKALAAWWGSTRSTEQGTLDDGPAGNRNAADRLVDYALDSGAEFFHDERHEPYLAVEIDGRRQIHRLGTRESKQWLAHLSWRKERKAASGETLTTTLTALASFALFEGAPHALHVRIARIGNEIWYDLGDWRAVRIDARGWEVVERPPILFRHFQHQSAQVEPRRGGTLSDIFRIVNLKDRLQRLLLLVYLVCALIQDVPRPVVVVHGEHGSGKSTLFLWLRELLDPSALRPQAAPDGVREFVQAASHNLCLYLDNVSHLTDWLSDAFCRLCTGDGFSKRQLYTDDDDVIYSLRGLGGINGINLVATRPDLLDRALILSLEAFPEGKRRTEEDCRAEFDRLKPYLLGSMFDAVSAALASVDEVELERLPRMADFARWGCAIARHLGFEDDEFLTALGSNTVAQNATAIDNSPVAQAVLRMMQDDSEWEDTPAATHQRLKGIAEELQIDVKSKLWPKTPSYLTRRLNEVKPNLARLGVVVTRAHKGEERTISFRRSGGAVSAVKEPAGAVMDDDGSVKDDGMIRTEADSALLADDGTDATDGTLVGVGADEWEVP